MSPFTNATLMITGGTGSFGSTVLKHFLDSDLKEIRIFSRDEKKQDDMRHELQAKHPEHAKKVKFYIGDVRNPQSVRDAMPGVDYIFHAAALKQVPSCEFFPMEAVRTNVIGTDNVLHAAIDAGVKRVVCLSTDKAAYPINAMGISKAMMERVIQHEPLGFHDYNCLQMNAFCVVSDSGTLPEESSFFTSVGHPFPAVCIRTSTERPEALDKGDFILAGIDTVSLLQAVDTAVTMNQNGDHGIPVPDYVEENVSTKVVKIIQSYTGVVNKMVWRKF